MPTLTFIPSGGVVPVIKTVTVSLAAVGEALLVPAPPAGTIRLVGLGSRGSSGIAAAVVGRKVGGTSSVAELLWGSGGFVIHGAGTTNNGDAASYIDGTLPMSSASPGLYANVSAEVGGGTTEFTATYTDIPDTGLTLVEALTLTATTPGETVIPAAAAGKVNVPVVGLTHPIWLFANPTGGNIEAGPFLNAVAVDASDAVQPAQNTADNFPSFAFLNGVAVGNTNGPLSFGGPSGAGMRVWVLYETLDEAT